MAVCLIN
jgi:RNA recognition motif-containing protein